MSWNIAHHEIWSAYRYRLKSEGQDTAATFVVSLPVPTFLPGDAAEWSAANKYGENTSRGLDLKLLRILMVDDDAESRELLNNILSERGAVVTLARSADEALQILSANNMDLLVGDIGMPEKDGYDLMREIRASTSEDIRSLKAIALTQFAHA